MLHGSSKVIHNNLDTHFWRQFNNIYVLSTPYIDVGYRRLGVMIGGWIGKVHYTVAGCRHIIHIKKFAFWVTCAPDDDFK